MGFRDWIAGRSSKGPETTARLNSLPESLAIDNDVDPSRGGDLEQLGGESEIKARVREVIGVFRPREVTMDTYDLMLVHPMVHFGLAIRRAALTTLPVTVESDDPEIKAGTQKLLDKIWHPFTTAASNALGVGHVVIAKSWETIPWVIDVEQEDGSTKEITLPMAWVYKRFKNIGTNKLVFLVDDDEIVGVMQKTQAGDETRVGLDKAFHWAYRREDVFGDPRGWAELNVAYTPWFDNMTINLFGNRYFERKGEGVWKGRAPIQVIESDGNKLDGFKIMARALQALKSGSVFTLPAIKDDAFREFLFDVELMSDEKRGDMFQDRDDKTDLKILRALLITDKAGTSGDGQGSMAQARVHAETMEPVLMSDATEYLSEVNKQIIDPWVEFNWGLEARQSSRTRVTTKGIAKSTLEIYKTVIEKVLEAEELIEAGGTVAVKDLIDMKSVLRQLGIPLKSPEELKGLAAELERRRKETEARFRGQTNPDEDEEFDDKEAAKALTRSGALEEDEE